MYMYILTITNQSNENNGCFTQIPLPKKTFTVHFPQIFFFVLFQEMVSERQSPTEEGVSVKKGGDGITQSIPS